ncbi:sensor histidine kinase [Cohnella sp. LGH]|uniref:sensor histidine kinase n=1 Tax=Cohnella sp. LGH TaxID=1619153 RepID=UPI001ADBAAAD|nr:sensor histidine kinase [Cohnella sp. LGH]QTH41865.1 sensor histidine kinase [Cohnella sp. LGH]
MRINFKYKLFLSLIAILLLASVTISAIWYAHSRNLITDTILQSTELLLNERNREIGKTIAGIDYQSRLLSVNNANVDRGLGNKWKDPFLNSQANKKLNSYIDSVYSGSLSIQAIELGNDRGDFYGRGIRRGSPYLREEGIDRLLAQSPDELLVLPYYDKGQNVKEIMFYRALSYYGKNIGYSMISISSGALQETYEGIFLKNAIVTVRNAQGQALYTSGYSEESPNETIAKLFEKSEAGGKHLVKDEQGKEWLAIRQNVASGYLTVQVAVPMEDILANIKSKFADILYITCLLFGLLLVIVFFVSNYIGRNVAKVSNAMQRFSAGDLERTLVIRSNDEFSAVAESFNEMTRSIRQLLEDVKAKEKEKLDLEIRALQGQINLHFLFNTLNTIKNLAYIQRVTNIDRLVGALMELLNISMAKGTSETTLETEIAYVEHYLEIYRYKSVKEIECVVDVDEEAKDAEIPKFMLQPIVENAIIHGIEANDEDKNGLIYIKAFRNGQDIEITIYDNGQGFDPQEGIGFSGIGISNTDRRIKARFGEAYGIRIESIPHESTTVHIRIPYRREDTP